MAALAFGDAVEFGEERIGEFGGFGRACAATQNDGSSRAKVSAVGGYKIFPGGFLAFGTRASQGEVFEMQASEESLEC